MPEVPKVRSLHIFAISPKRYGDEIDFLPADKEESFLQDSSVTLGVHSQACQKYPKPHVCNIFVISQGKCEGWSWFFACR